MTNNLNIALFDAVEYPLLTEKSAIMHEAGKYTFIVKTSSTKLIIKKFVEAYYKVKVTKVNVQTRKGKRKFSKGKPYFKSDKKIATVTLKDGDKIEFSQV